MTTPEIHTTGIEDRSVQVTDGSLGGDREAICEWLRSNNIDPRLVDLKPVTLEFRLRGPGSFVSCSGQSTGPWWIAFTGFHTDAEGRKEYDIRSGRWATCSRSTPLLVPPPLSLVPEWQNEEASAFSEAEPRLKFARRSEWERMSWEAQSEQ